MLTSVECSENSETDLSQSNLLKETFKRAGTVRARAGEVKQTAIKKAVAKRWVSRAPTLERHRLREKWVRGRKTVGCPSTKKPAGERAIIPAGPISYALTVKMSPDNTELRKSLSKKSGRRERASPLPAGSDSRRASRRTGETRRIWLQREHSKESFCSLNISKNPAATMSLLQGWPPNGGLLLRHQLIPEDAHILGSCDAHLYTVADDSQEGDRDAITDDDLLSALAREDQNTVLRGIAHSRAFASGNRVS